MSKFQPKSFNDFWPYYVREHSHPGCRWMHFVGSTLVLVLAAGMVIWQNYWVFFSLPIFGYGFAWFGHFLLEKNTPATFKYPLWSFMGDWKMWWLMFTGRMSPELDRAHSLQNRI